MPLRAVALSEDLLQCFLHGPQEATENKGDEPQALCDLQIPKGVRVLASPL